MTVDNLKTDILILGTGGAGLFAALHAGKANPDLDVTVASNVARARTMSGSPVRMSSMSTPASASPSAAGKRSSAR